MTNDSVWFIETVALASKHRQTCSAKVLAETSMVEWVRIFLCISPGFASVFKSPILIHYNAVPEACAPWLYEFNLQCASYRGTP